MNPLREAILNEVYSIDEIKRYMKEKRELEARRKRTVVNENRREVAEFILMLAQERGVRPDEITPPPNYWEPGEFRNPDDPHQTWGGRGKRPDWFTSYIDRGGNPDEIWIASDETIDGVAIPDEYK